MVVEVYLGTLQFLLGELQHTANTAAGESIDDGAPETEGEQVVDERSKQRSQRACEDHEPHFHAAGALGIAGHIDGRGYDHLGGEWYEGALERHEGADGKVVHIGVIPVEQTRHPTGGCGVAAHSFGNTAGLLGLA